MFCFKKFKLNNQFDFSQSGTWKDNTEMKRTTTLRELKAALHNPSLTVEEIESLYCSGHINKEDLLDIVRERGYQSEFKSLCQRERISLSKNVTNSTVRKIYCHQGQQLKIGDTIFEYDNLEGNSEVIVSRQLGLIEELSINVGQRLLSGDTIMKMITVK